MHVYPVNESQAITRARDKLRSMQLLARAGVGLPVTSFAHSSRDIDGLLDVVGSAPVVVKLLESAEIEADFLFYVSNNKSQKGTKTSYY